MAPFAGGFDVPVVVNGEENPGNIRKNTNKETAITTNATARAGGGNGVSESSESNREAASKIPPTRHAPIQPAVSENEGQRAPQRLARIEPIRE